MLLGETSNSIIVQICGSITFCSETVILTHNNISTDTTTVINTIILSNFWAVLTSAVDLDFSACPLAASLLLFSLACFKPRYSLYSSGIKTYNAICLSHQTYFHLSRLLVKYCTHSWCLLELHQCPPRN